jgi:hypothetical protein
MRLSLAQRRFASNALSRQSRSMNARVVDQSGHALIWWLAKEEA